MKDTSGAQVLGRTSLKRLGIVMVPTVIAAGALTVLMANGAVAVSFAISGQTAQMKIGQLQGTGFAQYGGVDAGAGGSQTAVAVSAFKTATISNGLCQSVATNLGPLGTYTLTLSASGADASDLVIDMQSLKASEADFSKINIGVDASTITGSAAGAQGTAGLFGQEADGATLTNIEQVSNATTAGSFDLHNMSLSIAKSSTGCIS
ncbi:MAG TPA: DUF6230 family protein [Actinospica sp.]|nr:DUF6230 family protein [Actinospica sp.]